MDSIARKAASTRARQALLSIGVAIGVTMMAGSVQAQTPTAATSVDLEGYRFRFESQPAEVLARPPELAPRSLISVHVLRERGEELVLSKASQMEPGCRELPAITLIANRYVAVCGHLGGRHYMYTLFRIGADGPLGAMLDAYDDPPRLTIDAKGGITARIARRDMLPGVVGPVYLPFTYRLEDDDATFGFTRVMPPKRKVPLKR